MQHSELFAWLASGEGERLLELTRSLPDDRLTRITRLRKLCTVEKAAAAVELTELRKRARSKFSNSEAMFFTPQGLEQSTGERIARYRASRFPEAADVVDFCCGIGGDALALAQRGVRVLAVDSDPSSTMCTSRNLMASEQTEGARALCANVLDLDLNRITRAGFSSAFFDPSRRGPRAGGVSRRVRNADEYSPPIDFIETLTEHFPFVTAKLSPAIDDASLEPFALNSHCQIEFITDQGECKEAILWIGDSPHHDHESRVFDGVRIYTATVLGREGHAFTMAPPVAAPPYRSCRTPGNYLYEPQPSVVRAHQTPVLGEMLDADPISMESYYLTSDRGVDTPFATRYRVLDSLPLRPAEVQKRCFDLGLRVTSIKTRWDTADPRELSRTIRGVEKRAEANDAVVIVATSEHRKSAIICEVMNRDAADASATRLPRL